jgi:hypothetical protein
VACSGLRNTGAGALRGGGGANFCGGVREIGPLLVCAATLLSAPIENVAATKITAPRIYFKTTGLALELIIWYDFFDLRDWRWDIPSRQKYGSPNG